MRTFKVAQIKHLQKNIEDPSENNSNDDKSRKYRIYFHVSVIFITFTSLIPYFQNRKRSTFNIDNKKRMKAYQ